MEFLHHLQNVQSGLRLLNLHGLSSYNIDHDRFLVEFLLFLAGACKDVNEITTKCEFLSHELPRILRSTALLENLMFEINGTGQSVQSSELPEVQFIIPKAHDGRSLNICTAGVGDDKDCPDTSSRDHTVGKHKDETFFHECSTQMILDLKDHNVPVPLVGLRALEHSQSSLEDFCRSYFMFHDMDVHKPGHVFKHLPILTFVEGYIYQLDGQNEEQLLSCLEDATFQQDSVLSGVGSETGSCVGDPFKPLRAALEERSFLTERITKELEDGREYWRLERSLCRSCLIGKEIAICDVIKAIKLKSFDYRVLNLLLYGFSNKQVNETHMEFLSISELLVEIADDLFDYEDDVLNNNFNILRMFVKIYGPAEAPGMLAQQIGKAEEQYQGLLRKLEPNLADCYQKRCEEAVIEGGSKSKHAMGSWTIPSLIINEEEYRIHVNASKI